MLRLACVLLVGAAMAALGETKAPGQTPTPASATPSASTSSPPREGWEPEILSNLPQPANTPASLFAPAPPAGPLPPDAERPYFQHDPLLDPPQLPAPGWFFNVEVDPTKAHVKNEINTTVANPATGNMDLVGLPSASLNWAISPVFELGYRLPSGFGEFLLGYRFLATDGSEFYQNVNGPGRLSSLLDINQIDLDYASSEFSLWPKWDMRWRVGLRYAYVYFDSLAYEGFDAAAAGNGIFETRVTNSYVGIGPHAGVDLARRFGTNGLAFVAKLDGAMMFGRIRQQFFEHTTNLGADGQPLVGSLSDSSSQGVPVLQVQAGLSWQPPSFPCANFFIGYRYEYWWEVGMLDTLNNNTGTFGEIYDQGVVLRAEFNF
jgi:hypothetical protein